MASANKELNFYLLIYLFVLLFSCSVMSESLQPHELQHARLPCPSISPGIFSDSSPLNWWCHPTISSSAAPFPTLNLSQHRGLFQWVSSSHQVAEVLELQFKLEAAYFFFSKTTWLFGVTVFCLIENTVSELRCAVYVKYMLYF